MNIDWEEWPPAVRSKFADSNPELAEDLKKWEESLIIRPPMTLEEYLHRVEEIKQELRKKKPFDRDTRGRS